MRVSVLAALSIAAGFSTMQHCLAPFSFIAVPLVADLSAGAGIAADATLGSGVIAGGIGRIPSKKRAGQPDLPPGVSQHSYDQCQNQLNNAQIHLSSPADHSVRVDGVPPACMDLATVLTGQPTQEGGAVPVPMGSASLQYNGVTKEEFLQLDHALKTTAASR